MRIKRRPLLTQWLAVQFGAYTTSRCLFFDIPLYPHEANDHNASALSHQRTPPLRRPDRELPEADHSNTSDRWYPYPSLIDGIDGHTQCLFNSHCGLAQIIAGLCWSLFDNDLHLLPSEIRHVAKRAYSQLHNWYSNLPDCLAITQERPLPQFLTLR
jgi:hypothetical protein